MYHEIIFVASAIGFIGGALGMFAFFDWRRKRTFIEYINRRLSEKQKERKL